ncbi:MAG: PAS domain-containing protein [Alphaproteobacteria bacterium]|nr:PAS domain-containing protein [Alphaproteobacteria bacterium]
MDREFPLWKSVIRAVRSELSYTQSKLLLSHWDSLWREDAPTLPERQALDPLAFIAALPHVFMIEQASQSDRLRYRLAGEEICSRYQGGIIGKYLDEITPKDALPQINAYFQACLDRPAPVLLKGILFSERPQPGMGERLLLPLQDKKSGRQGLIGITLQKFSFPDPKTAREQSPRMLHVFPMDGSPAEITQY